MKQKPCLPISMMLLAPGMLLASASLVQNRHSINLYANPASFQSEVSRQIIVGSKVSDDRKFLEENGFKCSIATSSDEWLKQITLGFPMPSAPPKLFAVKKSRAFPRFLDKQKWSVRVSFSGNKVTKTEAYYSYSRWD